MILAVNVGTSSIKFALFDSKESRLQETFRTSVSNEMPLEEALTASVPQSTAFSAIGARIVHGGDSFIQPVIVTEEVLSTLRKVSVLAPLHNPLALDAITYLLKAYPAVPIIGVFDTMFHANMPKKAREYALPPRFLNEHHIQRFGFHGLAHESMLDLYCTTKSLSRDEATIITVQLGSGCSMCAIKNGISVDTSMGFSPLEGLISRTRTGDIDPTIVHYLTQTASLSSSEIMNILNHESGLRGLSGTDGSMQELLARTAEEDASAREAIDMFLYRIQKYLGAYDFILHNAKAVVLGGGISEHAPEIWKGIFDNPAFGVSIGVDSVEQLRQPITKISDDSSQKEAYIAFVNEEEIIARYVLSSLEGHH